VLSGPSGVGKDAVLSRMRELMRGEDKPWHITVTATTRPRREMERDGVDYIFVDKETFQSMIENNELLEWAEVYGNLYGVPKDQVATAFRDGRNVIIKADVQGAATIKKLAPEALFVFLAPPDLEELASRLRARMTESPEALVLRLATAEKEMMEVSRFDHVVVNHQGRLDQAVHEITELVERERERQPARVVTF
jgi:guanylate kinase